MLFTLSIYPIYRIISYRSAKTTKLMDVIIIYDKFVRIMIRTLGVHLMIKYIDHNQNINI